MAEFDHLPLVRLPRIEPHRKTGAFPPPPQRDRLAYGAKIGSEVSRAVADQAIRPKIAGIDPSLILRVTMTSNLAEDEWRRAGFHVLAQDRDKVLILFTSDVTLREFLGRLDRFQNGALTDEGNPQHNALFANIEGVASVAAEDRIGPRLKQRGLTSPSLIDGRKRWLVDIEIWDADDRYSRKDRVDKIAKFIDDEGGDVRSQYIGDTGLIVIRAALRGTLLRKLCTASEVALIDLRPTPDLDLAPLSKITISDLPSATPPSPSAPLIGIVDSGLNAHPMLAPATIGSFGLPNSLGDADDHGHGTRVAGIAVYGDVLERIETKNFAAPFGLVSAKVVNSKGQFDDKLAIAEQMRDAIRELNARGCRIINISLGDADMVPYADGRSSAWAATLDEMARTLDVLIIVSAGNSCSGARAPWGTDPDGIVTAYPKYLFEPSNRIIDPAMAACILTVGSLAHSNGLRPDPHETADIRPLTDPDQPTPVTRAGPGVNGAVKPELVDYGGTAVFNGGTQKLMHGANWDLAGIVTTHAKYQDALFTAATGTSMAAPRVAFKAALLLRRFPESSANLLRAFLATCANVPEAAVACLDSVAYDAVQRCCGYGMPDVEKALSSEEQRVIRYADKQSFEIDQFALYEVPIPEDFRRVKGCRHIREIYEHYRWRPKGEEWPELPGRNNCKLEPGYKARQPSTLQSAVFVMKRDVETYGEVYYLAVFADRRWAGEDVSHQRYSVVVELMHEGEVQLYQQSQLYEEARQRERERQRSS
jgi:hypothetical protein